MASGQPGAKRERDAGDRCDWRLQSIEVESGLDGVGECFWEEERRARWDRPSKRFTSRGRGREPLASPAGGPGIFGPRAPTGLKWQHVSRGLRAALDQLRHSAPWILCWLLVDKQRQAETDAAETRQSSKKPATPLHLVWRETPAKRWPHILNQQKSATSL
ncbi:uncharacterized protein BDR25DRAFT_315466 [Lindgomyces ingoldianus]|uniref:Uncharacterized protein n=1 Tax=Lindgomyces ingoldianus TaxID=673940 RepID=A0ACB6QR56_9PLEO|nr:uncharacterized protein BDR25DRAFT_315466 [Lindgomyces ingoldianus]KAF2469488.1 hypothetical protein BDR25DRAFT_315466 [Lindgomyces ingoldianus]